MSVWDYNQEIKVDKSNSLMWQATVDEGGKYVNLSQEEIVCVCVKCVIIFECY